MDELGTKKEDGIERSISIKEENTWVNKRKILCFLPELTDVEGGSRRDKIGRIFR